MLIVTYGLSWPGIREQILEKKGSSPLWGCKVYHSLEMLGGNGGVVAQVRRPLVISYIDLLHG